MWYCYIYLIREALYSVSINYAGKSQWRDFVFEKTNAKNKPIGSNQTIMQQTWINYPIE